MAGDRRKLPTEFRHDSMLRIEQPTELRPPPKEKRKTQPPRPTKPNILAQPELFGFTVLRSGNTAGTQFAALRTTQPIVLSGCAWLSVLQGSVTVFGHTLDPTHQPVLVVSAPFAPLLLKLQPLLPVANTGKYALPANAEKTLSPAALKHAEVKKALISELELSESPSPVILVTSCPQDEQTWEDSDDFPSCDDLPFTLKETLQYMSLPSFDSFTSLLPSLRVSPTPGNTSTFDQWENWYSFTEELDSFLSENPPSELRVLVSGAGGTGKSTFARCLSNFLVAKCKGLIFLDTDVGQAELNLPGMVAAHCVSELHVGTAIAHIRGVPLHACLLGETTPRDDPDMYEVCVDQVSQTALNHARERNVPVIVNTDGWVSGVGAGLLNLVIAKTKPSHVVSMAAANTPKSNSQTTFFENVSESRMFSFHHPRDDRRSLQSRSMVRELQIAAYFSKELALGRVKSVALDQIPVFAGGKMLRDISRALLVMNGSIVAFETSATPSSSSQGNTNISGFGLVRGVSTEGEMAYISSPVPLSVLKETTSVIICEHIQVPHAVMLSSGSNRQAGIPVSPFLLRDHVDGSHHMQSRSSLQRRNANAVDG